MNYQGVLLAAVLMIAVGTANAQAAQKPKREVPPPMTAELMAQQQEAAMKEMEVAMAKMRIPFPNSGVPDEVKSICINGRKALAVRYGVYGGILWEGTPITPVPCK